MPSDPKDWTAQQWAEWAAGFCRFESGHYEDEEQTPLWFTNIGLVFKERFDPLNDLNHLGLVLDEIERRGYWWDLFKDAGGPVFTVRGGLAIAARGLNVNSLNLAVLLAAFALEDSE